MQEKQTNNNERRKKQRRQQEEADVKHLFVKNGYADLKRRHQNDENQEDF